MIVSGSVMYAIISWSLSRLPDTVLPVWLSDTGSTLVSNVVTLRHTRLVPGWVTFFLRRGKPPRRRIRHPGLLSLVHPSVRRRSEYPAKADGVNRRHIA